MSLRASATGPFRPCRIRRRVGKEAVVAKRRKKAEEGGGGFMTTYADMVTLLMAFFVMLFAMSSGRYVK